MRTTKVVVIGAGSASFGLETLFDLLLAKGELGGSTISLVDIDEANLEKVAALARLANDVYGAGFRIEHTTDRRTALRGAEFVVTAVAKKREEMWRLDFEVPIKHGVKHVLGENGGPGALFHSARSISLVLPIARDMEKICPDALLLNFTNPMSRVCLAVSRYTRIKAVGLCHQIGHIYMTAGRVLGEMPREPVNWDDHKAILRVMESIIAIAISATLTVRASGVFRTNLPSSLAVVRSMWSQPIPCTPTALRRGLDIIISLLILTPPRVMRPSAL